MISEGLNLMLYGMGTVFVFLTLLVICTSLMSAVVGRYTEEEEISSPSAVTAKPADARIISIIEAAISAHRNR